MRRSNLSPPMQLFVLAAMGCVYYTVHSVLLNPDGPDLTEHDRAVLHAKGYDVHPNGFPPARKAAHEPATPHRIEAVEPRPLSTHHQPAIPWPAVALVGFGVFASLLALGAAGWSLFGRDPEEHPHEGLGS